MIWVAAAITVAGILLSAFFSGSETGFYRVTRVRLAIDAKSGRPIAKALHWLVSRASLVVATVLIGNNIANYLVSLGLVLLGQNLLSQQTQLESLLPVLMTPVLFVYGELLPKYLFYRVPYKLVRLGAPFMLLCTALFLPVSMLVLVLEQIWKRITGTDSTSRTASLGRQELQRYLVEGQEAGVLLPIQRELAQNLFTYGARPIRQFVLPIRALPTVTEPTVRENILELAVKRHQNIVGVVTSDGKELASYYSAANVALAKPGSVVAPEPLMQATADEASVQVLSRMHSQHQNLVQVSDSNKRVLGVITKHRLMALLVGEQATR
jgi:CBS domain containing-hemolysin-like protein